MIKRYLLLLLFLPLFGAFPLYSQISYRAYYNDPAPITFRTSFMAACETGDGDFFQVYGIDSTSSPEFFDKYGILKTDSAGLVLWARKDTMHPGAIAPYGSDGALIAGYSAGSATGKDITAYAIDGAGNVLWAKTYAVAGDQKPLQVIKSKVSGYFIMGSDFYLSRTDDLGNLLWRKLISSCAPSTLTYTAMESTWNGGIAVATTIETGPGAESTIALMDSNGNSVGNLNLAGAGSDFCRVHSIAETEDHNFMLGGGMWTDIDGAPGNESYHLLVRVDSILHYMWAKGSPSFTDALLDGMAAVPGNVVVALGAENTIMAGPVITNIYKFDAATGNLIWRTGNPIHDGPAWDGLYNDFFRTSDGGFLVSGFGSGSDFYGIMEKIQPDGTRCTCSLPASPWIPLSPVSVWVGPGPLPPTIVTTTSPPHSILVPDALVRTYICGIHQDATAAYTFAQTGALLFSFDNAYTGANPMLWDFGDGTTSTANDPTHTFPAPGVYNVCLTVSDVCTPKTICQTVNVCMFAAIGGDTACCVPDTLTLSNASTGAVAWTWFLNGTSIGTGPTVNVPQPTAGTDTLKLIATNGFCQDTLTQILHAYNALPTASFTYIQTSLSVAFTETSTSDTRWHWDFGDGTTDTLQNPVHNYAVYGIYTVCLIALNDCGSDTSCLVIDCPIPDAMFDFSAVDRTVTFRNFSAGAVSYTWTFGDATTSASANPVHTYAADGSYNVCLIAGTGCSADTLCTCVRVVGAGKQALFNTKLNFGALERGVASSVAANGDILVTAISSTVIFPVTNHDALVIRLDRASNIRWVRKLDAAGIIDPSGIMEAPNGDVVVSGTTNSYGAGSEDMFVARFDSAGTLLYFKTYGTSGSEICAGSAMLPNGDLLLSDASAKVLKINPAGSVVWSKQVNAPFGLISLSVAPDGNIYIVNMGELIKTDSLLNPLWARGDLFSAHPTSVQAASDSGCVIIFGYDMNSTMSKIARVDKSGNFLWTRYMDLSSYPFGNMASYFFNAAEDMTGNWLVAGYDSYDATFGHPTNGLEDLKIGRFSRTGTLLSGDVRGTSLHEIAKDVDVTPEGGALFTGEQGTSMSTALDILLYKTNFIVTNPGCPLGSYTCSAPSFTFFGTTPSRTSSPVALTTLSHTIVPDSLSPNRSCDCLSSCTMPLSNFTFSGTGAVYTFTNASSGATGYYWKFGDGTTSTSANPTHTYTSPGLFNVCLVATNFCGADSVCHSIFISCATAFSISDTTPCAGQIITLTSTGFSGGSYTWFNNGLLAGTTSSLNLSWGAAGNDTIRLVQSFAGCSDTMDRVVVVNPVPTVSLGADTSFCAGGSVLLNAGSGFTGYAWSTGAGTSSISVSASGTYSVTVTDINGCQGSDSRVITVNPNPVVNLGPDTSLCAGSSVMLNAGSGFTTYAWSTGAGTSSISVSASGTYSVTVTDVNGCQGSDSRVITVHPNPVVNLGADTSFCVGGSAILNAGSGFSTYAWSTGAGTSSISASASGTYSVTVTDVNGCQGTDSRVITVNPNPVVNLGPDTSFCIGGSVILNAGSGFTTYAWSTGAGTSSISVSASGTYSVTVTDVNGCQGSDSRVITVHPNPVVNLGADTLVCDGVPLTLNAGSGFSSYAWSTGAGASSISVSVSGTYVVTVTDVNGCEDSDAVTVTIESMPSAGFSYTGGGFIFDFTDLSTGGVTSWFWDFGDGGTSATPNPSHTYSITTDTTFTVCLTVMNICGADTFCEPLMLTGEVEGASGNAVNIYPIPTDDELWVEVQQDLPAEVRVKLFSIDGKQALSQATATGTAVKLRLDVSGIAEGIYLLRIERKDQAPFWKKVEIVR